MAYGLPALNQNIQPNQLSNYTTGLISLQNTTISSVRVTDIILDNNHEKFKELGEWDALGTILYENVTDPNIKGTAKPLMGNNKILPLINEIVYLISLPSTLIGNITSSPTQYYINIVALWNHPHHNAYPLNANEQSSTQQKNYIQTELGNTSKIIDQSRILYLGKTFIERSNIHPLLPFEGDIITEGRWGNSIRIGSTVKNSPNTWSSIGTNGDPILILRNGQGEQTEEGWLPVVENINNDESSIYLTSTQNIPLEAASTNYNSYTNYTPQTPDKYTGKQVIVNSGRLVFNSNTDHILLSSALTIGFNSVKGFNFDTKANFVVDAPSIKLGSKDATQSMIKGDLLITELQSLLSQLTLLATSLQAVPQAASAATLVLSELPKISTNLEKTKSNVNKLI
jgi:hypothetical protein